MTKKAYISKSMHGANRQLLDQMIKIIEKYEHAGYKITVRQLYYQLVSRNVISNSEYSYKRTSSVLQTGRMTGQVDWETIVDRARVPRMPPQYRTMDSFVRAVKNSYRCFRWDDQDCYLEVLVEKEALTGILEPVTREYHVLLLADKGYLSTSAMHDVAQRLRREYDKQCRILYMGDHDPSGMDMVRDIRSRLQKFGCSAAVERIALTMDQIKQYELPPNPAKKTDPRSRRYYDEYGSRSWELDALDPEILTGILRTHIHRHLDAAKYGEAVRQEQEEKSRLERAVAGMWKGS